MVAGVALFLFLAVASVALFSFIAVAVWSESRRKEREAYYQSETIKKIAETQGPGATSAMELMKEQQKHAAQRMREGVKLGGLVTVAVGVGLMIMLRGLAKNTEPAYLVGVIPLLVGAALLVYGYFLAPQI